MTEAWLMAPSYRQGSQTALIRINPCADVHNIHYAKSSFPPQVGVLRKPGLEGPGIGTSRHDYPLRGLGVRKRGLGQLRSDATSRNFLGHARVHDRHDLARKPIDELGAVAFGGGMESVQLSVVPDWHAHRTFLVVVQP